jgi:aminopeptidase N
MYTNKCSVLLIFSLLTCALVANAQSHHYQDSYPKNPDIDILGYVFNLTFSDESDSISGVATTTARYLAAGLSELRLDLIEASDELEGKGMRVSRVTMNDDDLAFQHRDNQLFIDLGREMALNERIEVFIHYSGEPAMGLVIGPNKYGDRTFFSDNWSSRVRNWLPVVDHPSDKATTEMIIKAPGKYQVTSNGTVVETSDLGEGMRDSRNRIISFYDEDYNFQIVRNYIEDLNDVSGSMMYQKGAWTLHMLREKIGVAAYTKAVRSYYAEYMNKNAQTADLRRHMEEASGQELEQYFDQWLFQGGIPNLEISWFARGGDVEINIKQVQETYGFLLPVDFEIVLADGSSEVISIDVSFDARVKSTRSFDSNVVDVVIDPLTRLLAKWTVN